jgi:ectoine hydroxylase-related dioxygenase (phytanoyl-CoA dioxygenase family)
MQHTPTENQITRYQEQGFLQVEGFLHANEVATLAAAVEAAIASMGNRKLTGTGGSAIAEGGDWLDSGETFYERALKQRLNLWRLSDTVKTMLLGPQLGQFASSLADVEGLRCYHDQALYKPAWGNFTAWHLDNPYWPFRSPDAISVWIALEDISIERGCMWYLPGSHHQVSYDNVGIGEQFGDLFRVYPELAQEEAVPCPVRAGDAIFHNGLCAHAAGCNISPRIRRAMTCAYMPVGSTYCGWGGILPPTYTDQLQVGDVLHDERWLPLVWQREAGRPGRSDDRRAETQA